MTALTADVLRFLRLLVSDCDAGTRDHAWRKCSRCLAIDFLQNHQQYATDLVRTAIRLIETAEENLPTKPPQNR